MLANNFWSSNGLKKAQTRLKQARKECLPSGCLPVDSPEWPLDDKVAPPVSSCDRPGANKPAGMRPERRSLSGTAVGCGLFGFDGLDSFDGGALSNWELVSDFELREREGPREKETDCFQWRNIWAASHLGPILAATKERRASQKKWAPLLWQFVNSHALTSSRLLSCGPKGGKPKRSQRAARGATQ